MNPTQKSGCPIEQLRLTHPDVSYHIRIKKPLENPVLEVLPKVFVAGTFSPLGLRGAIGFIILMRYIKCLDAKRECGAGAREVWDGGTGGEERRGEKRREEERRGVFLYLEISSDPIEGKWGNGEMGRIIPAITAVCITMRYSNNNEQTSYENLLDRITEWLFLTTYPQALEF
ncbi:MAG: hypothetical protein F6K55_05375 [Moorea sp. SIO4A3]|nr:hypothetical protein [Moorena sp. SIO4A3]